MRFKNICLMAMMLFGICAAGELPAQESFLKAYANGSGGSYVVEASDKGLFLVASTQVPSGDSTLYGIGILKTKENGETEWFRLIQSLEGFYNVSGSQLNYVGVVATRDGGLYIGGQLIARDTFDTRIYRGFLLKTDSVGEIVWAKQYNDTNYNNMNVQIWFRQLANNYDRGVVLTAYSVHNNRIITSIDELGSIQWAKRFFPFAGGHKIEKTMDGNYITAGQNGLLKIDIFGNPLWAKTYDDTFLYVYTTKDNGFLLVGYKDDNFSLLDDPVIIKTDSDGNVEWARNIASGVEEAIEIQTNIVQLANGNFTVSGLATSCDTCQYAWYMNLTDDGEILSTKSYLPKSYPGMATLASDGGIVSTGSFKKGASANPKYEAFLLKADSNGNLACAQNVQTHSFIGKAFDPIVKDTIVDLDPIEFFSRDMKVRSIPLNVINAQDLCSTVGIENLQSENTSFISPNPASQTITISLKELPHTADISITDLSGKTLYCTFLKNPGQKIRLDISPLLKGIYFVKVSADGREYTQKLVVE